MFFWRERKRKNVIQVSESRFALKQSDMNTYNIILKLLIKIHMALVIV